MPQAAQPVAQDAQLAVPPAWERVPERERDVPQAAQPVALGDPTDAPPVPGEPLLVDRTAAGRADLRDDPQADC